MQPRRCKNVNKFVSNEPFHVTDDLVSEAMEEDITSELPCTLSIENSAQDSTDLDTEDQVSFHC